MSDPNECCREAKGGREWEPLRVTRSGGGATRVTRVERPGQGREGAGRGPGACSGGRARAHPKGCPKVPCGQHPEAHLLSDFAHSRRPPRAEFVCVLEDLLEGVSQQILLSLCVCCVQKCMFMRVRHISHFLIVLPCFCAEKGPPQESRHSPAVTQLILLPCYRGRHHPPGKRSWGAGKESLRCG